MSIHVECVMVMLVAIQTVVQPLCHILQSSMHHTKVTISGVNASRFSRKYTPDHEGLDYEADAREASIIRKS